MISMVSLSALEQGDLKNMHLTPELERIAYEAATRVGSDVDEHRIIIIRREPTPTAPVLPATSPVVVVGAPPRDIPRSHTPGNVLSWEGASTRDYEMYRDIFEAKDQFWLDTPMGRVPFYQKLVYDGNGMPKARFPDFYSKRLVEERSEEAALAYLEANKARVRVITEATNVLEKTALKYGYVMPEDFQRKIQDEVNVSAYDAGLLDTTLEGAGSPILTPEQALANGLDPRNIPRSPKGGLEAHEIWYIWDSRIKVSQDGMRDFAVFAGSVLDARAAVNVKTIMMDTDRSRLNAFVDYFKHADVNITRFVNTVDITDLRQSMGVDQVPTYVFLDKVRGRVEKFSGAKDQPSLRSAYLRFMGYPDAAWPPKPEWFAPSIERAREFMERNDGNRSPDQTVVEPGAEALPPPLKPYVPWSRNFTDRR
jgi:hypothetical protein